MLAGCGRSRTVGSDSCRTAVSLVEACRLVPKSCCLTMRSPALQITSLELCAWNLGAGKIVYFKLPKMGCSKKIFTTHLEIRQTFILYIWLIPLQEEVSLETLLLVLINSRWLSHSYTWGIFLSQDKLSSFLFSCLLSCDYSEFISQHSKWMLHLTEVFCIRLDNDFKMPSH